MHTLARASRKLASRLATRYAAGPRASGGDALTLGRAAVRRPGAVVGLGASLLAGLWATTQPASAAANSDAKDTKKKATASSSSSVSSAAAAAPPSHGDPKEEELTLRFVTVVYRHGARTPIGPAAGESLDAFHATWAPHCDAVPDAHGLLVAGQPGQLTRVGRAQLTTLGRWLRARYVTGDSAVVTAAPTNLLPHDLDLAGPDAAQRPRNAPPTAATAGFLPSDWNPDAYYLRATTIPRTQHSAGGLLQGLYPVQCASVAAADALVARWVDIKRARAPVDPEVVAVQTTHNAIDETMYPMWGACGRLRELYWAHRAAPRMALFESGPHALAMRAQLARAWNVPDTDFRVSWIPLFDVLSCREFHGLPPPAPVAPVLAAHPLATKEIADVAYGVFSGVFGGSDEILRLSIGRFLRETLQRMDSAKNGHTQVRCALVATHDTTIVPLSFTLPGVFDPSEWSPFASNVVIELLERRGTPALPTQWYVRVLYNGQPTNPRTPSAAHGASASPKLMTLDELHAHWAKWLPDDWERECKPRRPDPPAQKW